MSNQVLIDKLNREHNLSFSEWVRLLAAPTPEDVTYAGSLARSLTLKLFGRQIFFRGIIEFTNICHNDCKYCGIRCSNQQVSRYRLTPEDILTCCEEGYALGYRTFVLQGGEDNWYNDDRMTALIKSIRQAYPDCAITLSIGEKERASYQRFYDAGADRYLLRHETADEAHYQLLHPASLSWKHRMQCLQDLKDIGFQTGCGCMVGSPYQTPEHLAKDMLFMHDFQPQMIGIGPFIPHRDTPFRDFAPGSTATTLLMLSLCRLMLPRVLLPSTTALGTVQGDGRQLGVLAGCNVIMPNLSPLSVRRKYLLYDNKVGTGDDAAAGIRKLKEQMQAIGYEVCVGRGDYQG